MIKRDSLLLFKIIKKKKQGNKYVILVVVVVLCLARYVPSIASHHITWIQSSFINKNRNNKCIPWLCQQLENDRIHKTFKKLEKKRRRRRKEESSSSCADAAAQQKKKKKTRRGGCVFRAAGSIVRSIIETVAAKRGFVSLSLYSISSFSLSLSSRFFFFSCCCPWL